MPKTQKTVHEIFQKSTNPFTAKGFPIDKLNCLALDTVKSMSVVRAPTAVKALKKILFRSKRKQMTKY